MIEMCCMTYNVWYDPVVCNSLTKMTRTGISSDNLSRPAMQFCVWLATEITVIVFDLVNTSIRHPTTTYQS